MLRNCLYFILSCFFFVNVLTGQYQAGWALDVYSGINGTLLQPAGGVATPYDWDVNLVHANGFFTNDYAFVSQASALGILRDFNQDRTVEVEEQTGFWRIGNNRYAFDYLDNGRPHFGRGGIDVMGPSFSLQIGSTTRLGLFTRLRAMGGADNLDADFSFYPYDAQPTGAQISVDEVFGAAAAWSEYGLHVSQALLVSSDAELRIGLNLRYLSAIEGASVYNPAGTTFTKFSLDSIGLTNAQVEIGFSNGLRENPSANSAGGGIAGDIGIQYAWYAESDGGYRFTAGLSLLDLGRINFNQSTELHRFANEGEITLFAENYEFVSGQEDVDSVIQQLNTDFFGRNGVSLVENSFSIGLPTAISAQFTVQPLPDLRVSAAYVGDLPIGNRRFQQGEQLTFAAHYSKWWYGAGLTTSVYNFRYLNLGFQMRLGPLTLGTDRFFGTLAKARRLRSGDFYLGLKLHDFLKGKKYRRSTQFSRRGGRSREVKCYEF